MSYNFVSKFFKGFSISLGVFLLLGSSFARAGAATTVTITVPGTADPWLAGMPPGSIASDNGFGVGYDVAPAQSPVYVAGLPIIPGSYLTFSTTGSVSNVPYSLGLTPDGGGIYGFYTHYAGAQNGISNITAPVNSLLGVFLGPEQPDLSPAPGTIDFSIGNATNYLTLSPFLQQVFFIGDGLTNDNVVQKIYVPTDATRLYLGTMDGYGWYNNSGEFSVFVNAVPEPFTLLGVATALGFGTYFKKRLG